MKCYLGIDVGTSACKAVAFDESGRPVAEASREYSVVLPQPGWAELDSCNVLDKCLEVISDCARRCPESIVGLAVSSQGEAFTPVDSDGRPLGPAMVSSDNRAQAYATDWPRRFGLEKLYRITGHTPAPLFTLFKLLWLRDHQPQLWRTARKFLCFEDLLHARLGVEPAMSWPLAGRTMMFDVRLHEWSAEILAAAGLDPSRLARTIRPGSVVGTIRPDIAAQLSLAAGTVVVSAGHDQPCGALGAGVCRDGAAVYATGTVECITPAFSRPVFSDDLRRNNLATYDHAVDGMYVTVAYSLTGGNILRWFRDQFGRPEIEEARRTGRSVYELILNDLDDQPCRPMVLPYFTPTGTPYFDSGVTGAILGLRMATSRGEILRALLEGVAMEMRLNMDILHQSGCDVREFRAIGGGARSDAWNQLKADVIGKPLAVVNVTESGCLGAAMLVRRALEGDDLSQLAGRWVSVRSRYNPRPQFVDWYNSRFELYRRLYPQLRELLSSPQLARRPEKTA
ncbi:MAG: hypothetical protein HZA50_11120 [Planctomycetes bacterium]|nr:hypothetical protein [Planctomycetota bacterium]